MKEPKLGEKLDSYGYMPLHYSAQNNKLETTVFLLSKANVEPDRNECGATALHRAAYQGHLDICKVLIAYGASINLRDTSFGDLQTPLHKAVQSGNEQLVDFLVMQGADVNALDRDGLKPFELKSNDSSLDSLDTNSAADMFKDFKHSMLCLPSRQHSFVSKSSSKTVVEIDSSATPTDGVTCFKCGKNSLSFYRLRSNNLVCMSCKNNL